MKFFYTILFILPFFTYSQTAEDIIRDQNIPSLCYQKEKCRSESMGILEKYKTGQTLNLNFSERTYHGTCNTYGIRIMPFGAYLNLYIKKLGEKRYASTMFFGFLPEKNRQTPETISDRIHSSQEIVQNMKKIGSKQLILTEEEDLHYLYRPQKSSKVPGFLALFRQTNQNNLQTFGFYAGGVFICDTKLIHELP